jgi:hypothetical protein
MANLIIFGNINEFLGYILIIFGNINEFLGYILIHHLHDSAAKLHTRVVGIASIPLQFSISTFTTTY